MGDEIKTDFGLSLALMHELLKNLNQDWNSTGHTNARGRLKIAEMALVLIVGFCLGLRGEEISYTRIEGFFEHHNIGRQHPSFPHVIVMLMGRFKTETGERCHLKPLAFETLSGIPCRMWVECFLEMWIQCGGKKRGFAFADL